MPTAGELRLEQAHQRDLATIGAGVMSGVANLALGADPAAVSTWFFTALDAIMARVQTGYAQARRSGTGYIQSRATMAGADVDLRAGSLSTAQARTSLEVTGPVAFKRAIAAGADDEEALLSMATQMSGSAQRLAIAGDRDVLEQTIAHGKGVIGYRRVLGGPGCGFCAMLASRGAVYLSRESASTSRSGLRFHDHCRCHVEPMFTHEPDPPDVQRLQRQWQRITAGKSNDAARVAWRNYWENDLVDRSKLRLAAAKAGPPSPVPGMPRPAPGVVVRSGLDAKRTLVGLQEAWAAEAKRITGRNLSVDIPAGTSLQTAKEYAEGVLRGLERFPDAAVSRIRFGQMAADQYAEAGSREITFNTSWASMRNRPELVSGLQNDIAGWAQGRNGWSTRAAGNPMSLSLHEFSHVLDIDNLGERIHSRALSLATRHAALEGIPVDDLIARDISAYATSSAHELIAEAFTDVMLRGQAASPLARDVFDLLEAEYFKAGGRITPAFGTFPSKAAPNLAKMTVPQLRALAAERGIKLPARALKADIVRALEDAGPPAPRVVAVPGAARWLGNVDLPAAEAERIGQLVQAKSRREILDEIVQLRTEGATSRALANRIRGRAALPNTYDVAPQVDDVFRDELLAAVDNGTIDDVVRRHLAALEAPTQKRVVKARAGSTIGDVELGPTIFQQAIGDAPIVRVPAGDFVTRPYDGPDGAILARGEPLPAGFQSRLAAIRRGEFKLRPGLTADESRALDRYALSRVADPLNTALRQGQTSGFGTARIVDQIVDLDEELRLLDSAIAAGRLAKDTELYRGALMRPADIGRLQIGAITRESGFLSTTADQSNAFQIINWRKATAPPGRSQVIFKILAPKGTRVAAGHIDELEVLLGRDRSLRVVDILRPTQKGDIRVITLELLPDTTVLPVPLAKRTVAELRALAKERNITLPPKATKAQIVERLEAPPAQIRAAEQKALRDAARERNRQIEQATGTARLLAEVDELLVKKAEARVIRQRLDPKLIDAEQVFANADPAVREALAEALASARETELENRIREIFRETKTPGGWGSIALIRARMADVGRDELDRVLTKLALRPGVQVIPWDNYKALSAADRAAALRLGGQDNHAIRFENPAPVPEDLSKVRAAVTRLTTKAKIKVVGGKAGAKVKFDADTMESVGAEIADGAPVTVVTRGASVTLPDGTVVQVRKAQVTPVVPPLKPLLKPLTRREIWIAEAKRKVPVLEARLKALPIGDPGRVSIQHSLDNARAIIEQKPGTAHYKWSVPSWDVVEGSRILRPPTQAELATHIDSAVVPAVRGATRTDVVRELERQAELTPRSMLHFRGVEDPANFDLVNHSNSYAYYQSHARWVSIKPDWPSQRADLERSYIADITSNWHPPTSRTGLEALMAHEYGHHVTYRLIEAPLVEQRRMIKLLDETFGLNGYLVRQFRRDPDIQKVITDFVKGPYAVGRVDRHVSKYAQKNYQEFFAEVWSEYTTMGDQARPQVKAIGDMMRRMAELSDVVLTP